ncbi:GNAT family N-acetyltransferase [Vagococcus hydrophili]|uniref:GNAT family N-acetyltransferase n=1 Tax=Vagococcus hydrophili TaxID=2714947 RepID=A0A6G8AVZ0_9ENTE|nr:GNAT family N-acetyltransferase [Vagococcus hydrophili]QIL49105.1 GNAT family N-acetyltransferase [Vagococcus hydrophili]
MKLTYRKMTEKDEQMVTKIFTESFNYDTALHFGKGAEDGPPGYSDGRLFKRLLANQEADSLLITRADKIIGIIAINPEIREVLYFCVLPECINQGVGSAVWKDIEDKYGKDYWRLETPSYSLSNHHFYQKNGFKKTGEKEYPEGGRSYIFQK